MLKVAIKRWMRMGQCHPVWVLFNLLALGVLALDYARRHRHLDTPTTGLFSTTLSWRQNETHLNHASLRLGDYRVVIDDTTPALADQATVRLARALRIHPDHFTYVYAGEGTPLLRRSGLLLGSASDIRNPTHRLTQAQPALARLMQNPELPALLGGSERPTGKIR